MSHKLFSFSRENEKSSDSMNIQIAALINTRYLIDLVDIVYIINPINKGAA